MINSSVSSLKLAPTRRLRSHVVPAAASHHPGGGVQIQYVGFQSNARSKDYRYLVTDRKAEPREFVFSISLRALAEGRISYQDVARMCYEKLQESLSQETVERPLPLDASVSDQDLDDYRE